MTKHEFLTWAVPFFTLITVIGATLSIMRLLSKRSKQQHSNPYYPYSGSSTFLAFQPFERGVAFVYVMAALGLVLATGIVLTLALEF